MSHQYIRTAWHQFPKVHVLFPLNTLKNASESLYLKAKGGDVDAALELLNDYVLPHCDLTDVYQKISDKRPILVPVLAIENLGKNRIPAVFAEILAARFGLDVCDDIVQTVKANHTNAGAYERIVRQPMFDGNVEAGRYYVILDDPWRWEEHWLR